MLLRARESVDSVAGCSFHSVYPLLPDNQGDHRRLNLNCARHAEHGRQPCSRNSMTAQPQNSVELRRHARKPGHIAKDIDLNASCVEVPDDVLH